MFARNFYANLFYQSMVPNGSYILKMVFKVTFFPFEGCKILEAPLNPSKTARYYSTVSFCATFRIPEKSFRFSPDIFSLTFLTLSPVVILGDLKILQNFFQKISINH